jgi:hypothetical protein
MEAISSKKWHLTSCVTNLATSSPPHYPLFVDRDNNQRRKGAEIDGLLSRESGQSESAVTFASDVPSVVEIHSWIA